MAQKFPHLYPSVSAHDTQIQEPLQNQYAHTEIIEQPAPQRSNAPPLVVQNIARTVETLMPAIEQMSGLTRREIFLNLMKTGIKGGNINSLIDSLMGQKPAPEAKFIRYVKIAAVWIPAFIFLMGSALVGIYVLFKIAVMLVGAA